jgi:anti-sigma-K factor RskA
MIDRRQQELAALYAAGRLDGAEKSAFETALAANADLRALVDQHRSRLRSPSPVLRTFLPWSIAACLALACAGLAQLYLSSRAESALFRNETALSDLELRSVRQQLEAERLLARRELADAHAKIAANAPADFSGLQIITLTPQTSAPSEAFAIVVWNPATQEGLLRVEHLPPPPADRDYQLWAIDPASSAPIHVNAIDIDATKPGARIHFHPTQRIGDVAEFAISLEAKPSEALPQSPFLLLGK